MTVEDRSVIISFDLRMTCHTPLAFMARAEDDGVRLRHTVYYSLPLLNDKAASSRAGSD